MIEKIEQFEMVSTENGGMDREIADKKVIEKINELVEKVNDLARLLNI
jgi:hypothetical protein